ncbi:MAG: hypothetical protein K5771_08985, partial [Oscillospiraceae bacterium]|nr:hypothetical protein [Oscillospiraceae bacterium]
MKKLIALALILIYVFALCACGEAAPAASEPVVTEKIVEVEKEVPVIPEEYARFKDVVDALVAEEYDKAQELIEEMKPAPEIIEVKIDQDNFLDYFEYVEWNNKQIEKTSDGKIKSAYFTPQYVLKAEYAIAQEKADECSVEVGVKYITNFYYQAKTMKKVTIDYDALTFSTTAKPDEIYNEDELLTGRYYGGEEGRMTCILPFAGHVYMLSGDLCQIINEEDVSIVSAEGTIYLCSIPAEAGEPAADEKEAITVALKPGEILPAEFEQFKDVLDLLVNAGFDGAQALIEGMKPVPEPLPVVEVAITKDNFFDYFEYVDIPGIYIEN